MDINLSSALEVFVFIVFCTIYVCSILWIFGDITTRGAENKVMIIPSLFVIAGALALIKGIYLALLVWPAGYVIWFYIRPKQEIELTD